jgi:hypothetical protein
VTPPRDDQTAGIDPIAAIDAELRRIGADPETTGLRDSIGVNDEQAGWASLGCSEQRHDFYWYGKTGEILDRLQSLDDRSGPIAVRLAFHREIPEFDAPDPIKSSSR